MSERGMGAAVGQVPEYAEMITAWVKEKARTPVIVKLTPNISDIRVVARAAKRGGADALSLPVPAHLPISRKGCVILHERELQISCNCRRTDCAGRSAMSASAGFL